MSAGFTSITPLTWNVIGLDSNNVSVGPNRFPVGARVCVNAATTATVSFVWDDGQNPFTGNTYINLRAGTNVSLALTFAGAGCQDAYFEVEVKRDSNAYNKTRRYRITATDGSGTVSTPTPRELFVEHLISQSRNSVLDMQLSSNGTNFSSIPNGGTMSLLVGNTYWIKLVGATATNGYEQIESFVNFPNTIFQVHDVTTTWSAHSLPTPYDKLYGDGCTWENNPNSGNYRSCLGVGKNGGDVTVIYKVTILAVPTSPLANPESLSTLIYDFSGSSYHYNADYSTSSRFVYIVDPSDIRINKKFVPDTILPNGTSVLRFTIPNTTTVVVSGVNFTDTLPSGVVVSSTVGASTTGCGSPTFSPTPNANSLSFSNGTIAPNSSCVIQVNVTSASTGTYNNTTGHLFINGTTPGTGINTNRTGSTSLTVASALAPACTPGQTMVRWTVPITNSTAPPDNGAGIPSVKATNVATATASASVPANQSILTNNGSNDTYSWSTYGYKTSNQAMNFVVDTRHYSNVSMAFALANPGSGNGPKGVIVSYDNGTGLNDHYNITDPATNFITHTVYFTGVTSVSSTTTFRVRGINATADNSNGNLLIDNIIFTGCSNVPPPPTLSKAFSASPIAVNGTSRLTFTISNSQAGYEPLTTVKITDTLPSGLQVANPPNSNTTGAGCTGITFNPTAGATTLNYTASNMVANVTCTAYVDVTATRAGQFDNVSDYTSASESGANKTSTGYGTASLTAIAPPTIAKQYSVSPIFVGNTTVLTYTITNPNPSTTLNGIAFTDNLPSGISVTNGSSSTCGGTLTRTSPGTISLAGASLTGGNSCTFTVTVTGNTAGTYTHSTNNIMSTNGGTGNTATATVEVRTQTPRISLLKQVSTSPTGPWSAYSSPVTPGTQMYYLFTIENIGDVPLNSISVTDPHSPVLTLSGCSPSSTLPVANINDTQITTCTGALASSITGTDPNTATVQGASTVNGVIATSNVATATYSSYSPTAVKLASLTAHGYGVEFQNGLMLGTAMLLLAGFSLSRGYRSKS